MPNSELKERYERLLTSLDSLKTFEIFFESKLERLTNGVNENLNEIERIQKDLEDLNFRYEYWENECLEMGDELEYRRYNDIHITTYEEREKMGQGVLNFSNLNIDSE
jgi:hypothetical protein